MLGADHKGRYNFAACLGSMPGCGGLATKKKTISDCHCHIVDSCPHTLSSQGFESASWPQILRVYGSVCDILTALPLMRVPSTHNTDEAWRVILAMRM